MDRNHRPARAQQRQHKVGRVQKIHFVLAEKLWKANLLLDRVVLQFGSDPLGPTTSNVNDVRGTRWKNQKIVTLGLLRQDRLDKTFHIAANAGILDSAKIKGDSHGSSLAQTCGLELDRATKTLAGAIRLSLLIVSTDLHRFAAACE